MKAVLDHEAGQITQEKTEKKEKKTQAQVIISLCSDMKYLYDEQGESYVQIKTDNHYEVWPVKSETLELILIGRFMNAFKGKVPSQNSLKEATSALRAKARLEGKKTVIHTRIAETDETIYIDLCNDEWEVIEIKKDGWEVIPNPPVYFKRSKIMQELPSPSRKGNIEDLKPFLNYDTEDEYRLIIAWLLSTMKENNPFPILTIQGEQGSAKSTITKVLRRIIDPSGLPMRKLPNDEQTLAISANNTWILAYDNLSGLSATMSDSFCTLSTGGGLSVRTLYTTSEESVFQIMRPCILNGIDDIGQRPDLLDRSIVINLPSISESNRSDEKTFWKKFHEKHSSILGALCDVACGALKELPDTKLKKLPRMADFAKWITACETSLGWGSGNFMDIYNENRGKAIDQGLESDPIAVAVQLLMENRTTWKDTTENTLNELGYQIQNEKIKNSKAWTTPNKLKNRLRRITTSLRTKGIEYVELPRSSRGGMIEINRIENQPTLHTLPTQSPPEQRLSSVGKDVGKRLV